MIRALVFAISILLVISLVALACSIRDIMRVDNAANGNPYVDMIARRMVARDATCAVLNPDGVWIYYDRTGREVGRLAMTESRHDD